MKFKSSWVKSNNPKGKTFTKNSLTIPGQDMTVQEILRRFVDGKVPQSNPIFHDTESLHYMYKLDRQDKQEYLNSIKQYQTTIQQEIKDRVKEHQLKQREASHTSEQNDDSNNE